MDERCTMETFSCCDGGMQLHFKNGYTLSILNEPFNGPYPVGERESYPFVEITVFCSTEDCYVHFGRDLVRDAWEQYTIKVTPHQLVKYLAAVEKFKPKKKSLIGDGPSQLSYLLGRLRWDEWNKGR